MTTTPIAHFVAAALAVSSPSPAPPAGCGSASSNGAVPRTDGSGELSEGHADRR